jgi:hypothetical protein
VGGFILPIKLSQQKRKKNPLLLNINNISNTQTRLVRVFLCPELADSLVSLSNANQEGFLPSWKKFPFVGF